jgi:DNA-binding MarR family transcriptional regulator
MRYDGKNQKLALQEKKLLKYLVSYPEPTMPTRQQMAERLNVSVNRIQELLRKLEQKGYLTITPHVARGIELTEEAEGYV